jgi:hypothetical protein
MTTIFLDRPIVYTRRTLYEIGHLKVTAIAILLPLRKGKSTL